MTARLDAQSSESVSIFHELLGWNLARVKFFVCFICAPCKVQIVGFDKVSTAFNSASDTVSSLRRILRFMAKYHMDSEVIVLLIFRLLPLKHPYRLAMDRANWKF